MQKILIVEDDTNINNLLQEALSKAGYSCEQAFSGTEAKLLLNMQEHSYALVLLDLMLPGITGEAVLEEIRKKGNLPVIVLTAKDSLDEKVKVLTSGADDYITKPFEIREVLARIQVQLRHTEEKEIKESNLSFREMVLNKATFQVSIGGKILPKITRQEFAILELLLRNPKQVFTGQSARAQRALAIHAGGGVRKAVEVAQPVIETMRGETLADIIYDGQPIPNTGVPGYVGGYALERLIRASGNGRMEPKAQIGDIVKKGQLLAVTGGKPVYSQLDGVIRGMLQEGVQVKKGLKIGDVDPRKDRKLCYLISDKANKIGSSVVRATEARLADKDYAMILLAAGKSSRYGR